MKISTEIGSAAQLVGEEKAVEYVAKAGFDAWDFSMFDMCGYDWRKKVLGAVRSSAGIRRLSEVCQKIKADWPGQWHRMQPVPCTVSFHPAHAPVFEACDRMYGGGWR